ncbi:stage II sporulation protein AB (anti-sigma F factor) [Desulfitispora alkaliphila]|uniref:anti-sigma F factor n=1 Tax=Desulfitispora alkaliphila TaxID=622674 RepID=UPI003D1F3DA2
MSVENRDRKTVNFAKFEFLSCPENVGLARMTIASFASQLDMTLNDLEELKVAASEAVSNSVIHGYENKPVGTIRMIAHLYEDALEIVIEDDGKGIEDIELATQPAYSTVPERMGLGFVFMNSFMDEVHVKSNINQGTKVILRKYLASQENSAQSSV